MSNFDEKTVERIKKLEREVERLRVKESPGAWVDWTPTVTGWAAGSGYICRARYCKVGKLCFICVSIIGMSNSIYAKASLPPSVPAEQDFSYFQVPCYENDSIVEFAQCFGQIRPSNQSHPNELWFWRNGAYDGWTASGGKSVIISAFYEVA